MRELLSNYFAIQVNQPITIRGLTGYKNNEYSYFIIQTDNNKAIHMEQIVLSYYLYEIGFQHVALPIQNREGEWLTSYNNKTYMVVQVASTLNRNVIDHGTQLARFHQAAMSYPYEPTTISSYGQWKNLWIEKLTHFETQIQVKAKEKTNHCYRFIMDALPYVVGISENAIQYMQESEEEQRFDLGDQATITFFRYDSNVIHPIIWPNDLVYDHSVRDLAEHIRNQLLEHGDHAIDNIMRFIKDYQNIRLLSPFSWRLLFARLLFPVHLFDQIGAYTLNEEDKHVELNLKNTFSKQRFYEQNLRQLFEQTERNNNNLHLPMLHWL